MSVFLCVCVCVCVLQGILEIDTHGFLSLIDEEGNIHNDISLPPDEKMAKKIKDNYENKENEVFVSVITAFKRSQIKLYTVRHISSLTRSQRLQNTAKDCKI